MKIMTGKAGTPHVTAQQFRQFVEGTVGQESYILTSGDLLEPELVSNNNLKIRSGIMSHHGNLSTVDLGTYDTVTIRNGSQGMKRIDLVVNRYTKNKETGIEKNEWIVIMGNPTSGSPSVPTYTQGNLQEGDLVDDCPVFEVHLSGINVTDVKKMLKVVPSIPTINKDLSELSAYEKITLKDGVHLTRYGKLRILSLVNASSPTAGDIVRLPSEDTPSNYVMSAASLRGQTRGDFFISITPNNAVPPGKVGLFFGNNTAQSASGGYIVACVTWCV